MINPTLLKLSSSRAPGIAVYGATGLHKTGGIATCPPPILMLDIGEGGDARVLPWIRQRREWHTKEWTQYTQEDRQAAFDILEKDIKAGVRYKPNPYIDVIHFDNMNYESYNPFVELIGDFDVKSYNTLAIDSLQELIVETQTYTKGPNNSFLTMNEIPLGWIRSQERSLVHLRKLRNYRDSGVVIYLTGSEDISKDYVNSPLEKHARGEKPSEPYSIRGTINLPGKLAEALAHLPDILCHARLMNGKTVWVTTPEALPGGEAWWDAKDRYGRLPRYIDPDVRKIFKQIYGEKTQRAIYAAVRELGT
jgi:hypothetical protein